MTRKEQRESIEQIAPRKWSRAFEPTTRPRLIHFRRFPLSLPSVLCTPQNQTTSTTTTTHSYYCYAQPSLLNNAMKEEGGIGGVVYNTKVEDRVKETLTSWPLFLQQTL